jgi:general stress protein 26
MDREEIISAAQQLGRAGIPFVLATVDADGVPQMRWMGAAAWEGPLTAYMAVGAQSRKMAQIEAHPQSQLMFHSEDYSRVATLTGRCGIVTDLEAKRRLWKEMPGAANHFSGPEDPAFGLIRFTCRRVEVIGMTDETAPAAADL